ncbi:MAG: beta-carotene 15,15'-monooxygenase, partial [Chryseobacterium sp.]|nr:beta-carotene 15,15'-monooxygenase [Chryseobacterium sp.]
CILPFFFVIPLLLLGYPVLLFENATFSEALSKSFKIAKENYMVFLGASFLGLLISIAGILLCGIGIVATIPFYMVVMYSAYIAFCGRPKQLNFNN